MAMPVYFLSSAGLEIVSHDFSEIHLPKRSAVTECRHFDSPKGLWESSRAAGCLRIDTTQTVACFATTMGN
jgi:hypothetical protein